jgi:hypothetical protein
MPGGASSAPTTTGRQPSNAPTATRTTPSAASSIPDRNQRRPHALPDHPQRRNRPRRHLQAANRPGALAPRLKVGHVDKRFDGEPAIGRVRNLRLTDDGEAIIADYTDVPQWLADALPSAYPGRSIEAAVNGDSLDITGVALLGVTLPGITNLADLEHRLTDTGPLRVAAGEDAEGHRIQVVIASTEEAAHQVGELVDREGAGPRPQTHNPKESSMDPKELRKSIGLAEDASNEDVKARIIELKARPENTDGLIPEADVEQRVQEAVAAARAEEQTKVAASRDGEVTLDKATHERLLAAAALAEDLNTKTIAASRATLVSDAVRLGKIEPSRADYWRAQLDEDTEHATKRLSASVADGGFAPYSAVPVTEIGASGPPSDGGTVEIPDGALPEGLSLLSPAERAQRA